MAIELGAADRGAMGPAPGPHPPDAPPSQRRGRLLARLLMPLLLTGCAAARPALVPTATGPGAVVPSGSVAPWEIPEAAYSSQTLFRMDAETADGGAAVRLVLRLEGPERYRLTLSDRLGRTLYTVDVGPSGGWLVDHRSRKACPVDWRSRALELRGAPLEGFSLAALPALLLGRVPEGPAGGVTGGEAGELIYLDRRGRRWSVRSEGDEVSAWTLWQDGEPVAWWRRDGERALLSDRLRGAQLRWQVVAREALPALLPEPAPPAGFETVDCREEEPVPFDSPQSGL